MRNNSYCKLTNYITQYTIVDKRSWPTVSDFAEWTHSLQLYGDPALNDLDNADLITVLEIVNEVVDLTEKSTLLT